MSSRSKTAGLLFCPFCGNFPFIQKDYLSGGYSTLCSSIKNKALVCEVKPRTNIHPTISRAKKAWNAAQPVIGVHGTENVARRIGREEGGVRRKIQFARANNRIGQADFGGQAVGRVAEVLKGDQPWLPYDTLVVDLAKPPSSIGNPSNSLLGDAALEALRALANEKFAGLLDDAAKYSFQLPDGKVPIAGTVLSVAEPFVPIYNNYSSIIDGNKQVAAGTVTEILVGAGGLILTGAVEALCVGTIVCGAIELVIFSGVAVTNGIIQNNIQSKINTSGSK